MNNLDLSVLRALARLSRMRKAVDCEALALRAGGSLEDVRGRSGASRARSWWIADATRRSPHDGGARGRGRVGCAVERGRGRPASQAPRSLSGAGDERRTRHLPRRSGSPCARRCVSAEGRARSIGTARVAVAVAAVAIVVARVWGPLGAGAWWGVVAASSPSRGSSSCTRVSRRGGARGGGAPLPRARAGAARDRWSELPGTGRVRLRGSSVHRRPRHLRPASLFQRIDRDRDAFRRGASRGVALGGVRARRFRRGPRAAGCGEGSRAAGRTSASASPRQARRRRGQA